MVLAGGLGSRFGGDKQLAAVGPGGETLAELTTFDARRGGFEHVVLVVRPEHRTEVERRLGARLAPHVAVQYAEQSAQVPLPGLAAPHRTRPWGTAHALACAAPLVLDGCAVVNADDWYGPEALARLGGLLRSGAAACLVTHALGRTLSPHGPVNRAVCDVDVRGRLQRTAEHTGLQAGEDGVCGQDERGALVTLGRETRVSMNLWGFSTAALALLVPAVTAALRANLADADYEARIPDVVEPLIRAGALEVAVEHTEADWAGLTHPSDLPTVRDRLAAAATAGCYPTPLWPAS